MIDRTGKAVVLPGAALTGCPFEILLQSSPSRDETRARAIIAALGQEHLLVPPAPAPFRVETHIIGRIAWVCAVCWVVLSGWAALTIADVGLATVVSRCYRRSAACSG
jgi:hypothetical protein